MEKFYNLPHHNQAIKNQNIRKYLNEFLPQEGLLYYGFFWIIMEILHQEGNKITIEKLADKIMEYLLDLNIIFPINVSDCVDKMFKVGLLKKDIDKKEEFIFSPYQRLIAQMKENHQNKLSETNKKLNERVTQQEGLIKRMNDKIDFLKSDKKKIKETVIKTRF